MDDIIIVHHMNPLQPEDLDDEWQDYIFDPEYLITMSMRTHNKLHYKKLQEEYKERKPGDTLLW